MAPTLFACVFFSCFFIQTLIKWSLMPTSMTLDWSICSLVLNKMWYINELEYDSKNNVDIEFSAQDAFLE
jgi:hypothetical protein